MGCRGRGRHRHQHARGPALGASASWYGPGVPRWQRIYVTVCAAVVGYILAYVLSDFGEWPKLTYFPLEGQWGFRSIAPGSLPMSYLGLVVWGLVGGASFAAVTAVACHVRPRQLSNTALRLWGGWAMTAFGFGGLYFTWGLWPF